MDAIAEAPDQTAETDRHLSAFIGYAMKRALSIVQADFARTLADYDLRAVSFSALSIIVGEPGLTQTQLADALQIERSNLVTIIDELAGRNLIIRAPVAQDRRRHALMPTTAGKQLAAAAQASAIDHERRLFACLTEGERAELQRILRKFRKEAVV
ncbi:MAG: MarR family transcriptional regulator [Tabrizicola sp.]|jgi:DNA-binding MarR family transcriptional regulator|nr:MarR family transcriptional regulator [Tabrizicola sp.]